MTAGRYNFTIEQDSTYDETWTWKDGSGNLVNLTGYTAELSATSNGVDLFSLNQTPAANGDVVTLGGAAGTIRIYISDETAKAYNFLEANYTLEMTHPAGKKKRLVQGVIDFSRDTGESDD